MLHIIGVIGTAGGTGYVIEFAGEAIEALSVEVLMSCCTYGTEFVCSYRAVVLFQARMSICNMAIEAGAKAGIIAPDDTTIEVGAVRD